MNQNKSFIAIICLLFVLCKHHGRGDASRESQILGSILTIQTGFNLGKMLGSIADNSILPAYYDMYENTDALYKSSLQYQLNPNTANLDSIRSKWGVAKSSIKRIEVLGFGPAILPLDYLVNIDYYPRFNLDTAKLETDELAATNSQTLTATRISSYGVIKRGISCIEYLVYDNGSGLSDLSSVNTTLTSNSRRIQYIVAVASDLKDRANQFNQQWQPTGSNFTNDFKNGVNSFSSQRAVLDEITNQMIFQLSTIIDNKIGDPAGLSIKSSGRIDLNKLESKWSNHSLDDISANVDGIKLIYFANYKQQVGVEIFGLTAMVSFFNPTLDDKIKTQIKVIESQIQIIKSDSVTLRNAISQNPSSVANLYNSVRALRLTLSTELILTLGASIGISSSDGD
jgi:predicted lipoprotein